jgi:hypothetical protein
MTPQDRLLCYMHGWRIGVTASAYTDDLTRDADFKYGLRDGRETRRKAYAVACGVYGAQLPPLRVEQSLRVKKSKQASRRQQRDSFVRLLYRENEATRTWTHDQWVDRLKMEGLLAKSTNSCDCHGLRRLLASLYDEESK